MYVGQQLNLNKMNKNITESFGCDKLARLMNLTGYKNKAKTVLKF